MAFNLISHSTMERVGASGLTPRPHGSRGNYYFWGWENAFGKC